MTEKKDGFQESDESMVVIGGPMDLSPAVRAEIDIQISTAKAYPRSLKAFKQQALDMATFDEETASGCFYVLKRGDTPIEGPSARLAEIVLSAWGNVRADARIIGADDKEITAEAMTWDLEKNVAIRVQVKRRITNKYGKRYSDDMITMTGNAACSIALRNSVFKVIPMVYTKSVYRAARLVAIGDISTLEAKRSEAVAYFGKMGITPDRVLAAIEKESIEDVGLEDVAILKGLATALRDGDANIDETFPSPVKGKEKKSDGPPVITEDQRKEIAEAAKKSGAILLEILKDFGFSFLKDITVDQFDYVLAAVKAVGSIDGTPEDTSEIKAESEPSVVEKLRDQIKEIIAEKGYYELSKKTRDELESTPIDTCDDPARLSELLTLVTK